ncbi:MAG TPA: aminotransferase class V-fold PLP-dependent enzyme [Candidatus Krumholzibacterium sp.]|nr:aminotransferase class V-fold PLP-dependent enzyme [Candidatus Krumholzibacterium sp.]
MSPGPVHIPPSLLAGLEPMHHRTDSFREIVRDSSRMLSGLVASSGKVFLLTMSGTGAMESAVVNLTGPGTRVLVVSGGKFGDRWAEIARVYGCLTATLRFGHGERVAPEAVSRRVEEEAPEVLFLTHVESSTGLLVEIEDILRAIPEPRPVVVVDAIASIASEELKMDEWGIDLVVGAGQKALAAPAGISFVVAGEKARRLWLENRRPAYYMAFSAYEAGLQAGDTPFTPAVQSVQVLHRSLESIFDEGAENVRLRHSLYSRIFMDAMSPAGLKPFPAVPSSSVQALAVPDGIDAGMIIRSLRESRNIVVTGGQGDLSGRIIRTGFLGIHRPHAIRALAEGIADALGYQGHAADRDAIDKVLSAIDECPHDA